MKITEVIRAALFTPASEKGEQVTWGLNLMLWGDPGVGKTHRIKDIAEDTGLPVEVLSPAVRGEGAFGVVPVPNADMSKINFPPPSWVQHVEPAGLVFLDEANQAPPTLQPAIMSIALDRCIGAHRFGPRTRVIAAGNPPEKAAGGWDFAAPTANRFGHLDWEAPDPATWASYMMGETSDRKAVPAHLLEEQVLAGWGQAYSEAKGVVISFIRARGTVLHQMPQVGDSKIGRAWPSPRTWEMATRAMAGGRVHNLGEVELEEFVSAFVGHGAASELWAYREKVDLPNTADLLDGRAKWKHDPKRLDRTEAVLSACAALVVGMPKADKKRLERAEALWQIMSEKSLQQDAPDLIFLPTKALASACLHVNCKSAKVVLKDLLPVLREAGVSVAA